jgi:hypothetical protein
MRRGRGLQAALDQFGPFSNCVFASSFFPGGGAIAAGGGGGGAQAASEIATTSKTSGRTKNDMETPSETLSAK